MSTIETLKKLKETITHQMNTGLAVQFSDLDLVVLSEIITSLKQAEIVLPKAKEDQAKDYTGIIENYCDGQRDYRSVALLVVARLKRENKEFCICAAVLADDDTVYRGHRHGDAIGTISQAHKKVKPGFASQGFITSRSRFVDRYEGFQLQKASGIPSAYTDGGYRGDVLFSEDLY